MSEGRRHVQLIDPERLLVGALRHLEDRWETHLRRSINEIDAEPGCGDVVVAQPRWDGDQLRQLQQRLHTTPVRWLPVCFDRGITLGPVMTASAQGCPWCARSRRRPALPLGRAYTTPPEATFSPPYLDAVLGHVLPRALDIVAGGGYEQRSIIELNEQTLQVHERGFLPLPTCPLCGPAPPDHPEPRRIELHPRRKPDAREFRSTGGRALDTLVEQPYVETEIGIVSRLSSHTTGLFPAASAVSILPGTATSIPSYGQASDHRTARALAVLEMLERLAGAQTRQGQPTVQGCYRELGDDALDPRRLGLYSEDQYGREGFSYPWFDEDLPLGWVWGYSLGEQRPLLVPECIAYQQPSTGVSLVRETSNGCAVGSCLEEAIFHGLVEVAERDAFLLTWYARARAERLALQAIPDQEVRFMTERMLWRSGYRIQLFDITTEIGVPSFWALAVDETSHPVHPATLSSAGAHPCPRKAVKSALRELAGLIDWTGGWDSSRTRSRAARMIEDPFLVAELEDHLTLYAHPETVDRFAFVLGQEEAGDWPARTEAWTWPQHTDLRADLDELLGRFLRHDLDVIVVEQTTPELRWAGLVCVKVIVPGALPMTFGHAYRRTGGLPRLYSVPFWLGRCDRMLGPDDLNPHPHPFG
ncbi:hypothetical protein GCM10012275_19820 [Longimycelium tulufanense]|uniref:YcaO domain-containing protein n=1 Tax=Longimycelium tulufanense TaxID=907463 RepID=A0A8J3C7J9_9PSEU|nr:TOMM precursor leader peptide-binding protein [Longimycelium tulufanense]GGM48969.1 hypothetical protein GCM10012275_19820 [Longimycelium tulufanense]